MSFVRTVALRYLLTKRSEAFISILTFISTIALAIGVAVLVVVMSIMNGFEYELKDKLLGANAHITVRAVGGSMFGWQRTKEVVEEVGSLTSVSPYTYHQGLLQVGRQSNGVLIRGVRTEDSTGEELYQGLIGAPPALAELFQAPAGEHSSLPGIVLGKELAENMLVKVGDVITILSPQVQSSPFGLMPRFRRFSVSAVYSTGLTEYESSLVYVGMDVAQSFFRMGNSVQGLEVRVEKIDDAPVVADTIKARLQEHSTGIYVQPWTETHKNLFEALQLERSAYFTVLLLLVVMASFSIVSTLVMLVLEKRKDIAVLRTLGATQKEVGRIFRITGMAIGLVGTLSGLMLGLLINLALQTYGFPLPEKIFPVATLPIRMEWSIFAITGGCALLVCFLATLYPVKRASSLRPTELLRYE